jgi:hypothetical protein
VQSFLDLSDEDSSSSEWFDDEDTPTPSPFLDLTDESESEGEVRAPF